MPSDQIRGKMENSKIIATAGERKTRFMMVSSRISRRAGPTTASCIRTVDCCTFSPPLEAVATFNKAVLYTKKRHIRENPIQRFLNYALTERPNRVWRLL